MKLYPIWLLTLLIVVFLGVSVSGFPDDDSTKQGADSANLLPQAGAAEQERRSCFRATVATLRKEAEQRKRVLPRTLVYTRAQMKYWNNRSYAHVYNDRPLFADRSLGGELDGYRCMLELVAKYDLDGIAFFPQTYGRMRRFQMTDQAGVEGVGILPEFIGGTVDQYEEVLRQALRTKSVARINGKVLISSYGAQSRSPETWREILTELRKRQGDCFIFLPSLTYGVGLHAPFKQGTLCAEDIDKVKALLREYLDVCDGIYFNYPPALRLPDRTFDRAFFEEVFIPVYRAVLAEQPYRNKLLGMAAYKAHMMPERGHTLHEDGTRTMRNSFEPSLEAEVDVIILPEWDEFNENTCWMPTLYSGTAPMRIIRYYMSQIRHKPPTPLPGDDPAVPNLIVSTRKRVTLGEELIIELLNVPDTTDTNRFTVAVELRDESGATIHCFPPAAFNTAVLQEARHRFATETVPQARALVPCVTIQGYRSGADLVFEAGLQPVQLRTTWNDNYLYVKQALRDTLQPTQASLAWSGENTITGTIKATEPLALVELVADDREVYAVDPTDEFQRSDPERIRLLLDYSSIQSATLHGTVTVLRASAPWKIWGGLSMRYAEPALPTDGTDPAVLRTSQNRQQVYLTVPKADVATAEICFDFGEFSWRPTLRELFAQGMLACAAGTNGVFMTLAPYDGQFHIPQHLNQNQAQFRVMFHPETADELYLMRVTTKSGRQFRSHPLLRPLPPPTPVPLRIYSSTQQAGVTVTTAVARIPDIEYLFDSKGGAVLRADAGRPFWGALGGASAAVTGKGNVSAILDDVGALQQTNASFAPTWCTVDERTCLRFDGQQSFIKLPREVLPSRGSFTIELEIKPLSDKDQYLLANRMASTQNGLALEIRKGLLYGSFRAQDWELYSFPTALAVPAGQWTTIRVVYDFETICFEVNGKSALFPLHLPGCNLGYTMIGDGGWRYPSKRWFEGYLSRLRIRHTAE